MSPYEDEDQKYYDAVDQEDASLRLNAYSLNETQPADKAARALELGQKKGLPRVAIESDLEGYEAEDEYERLKQLGVTAPKLYKWLSQTPDNYAVAKDEMDLWGSVEDFWWRGVADPIGTLSGAGKNILNAGRAGFMSAESSLADMDREQLEKASRYYEEYDAWSAREAERKAQGKGGFVNRLGFNAVDVGTLRLQLPGDTDPMPRPTTRLLQEAAKRDRNWYQQTFNLPGESYRGSVRDIALAARPLIEQKMDEAIRVSKAKNKAVEDAMPQTGDFLADSLLGGVRAITEMSPLIVSALATRGKTVPALVMGGQVYYNEYATGREADLSIDDSTNRALLQAGVETISERISLGIIDDMLKSDKSLVRRFAGTMLSEQVQEQAATLGNRLVDWNYLTPEMTLGEFVAETPRYMVQTALTTMVASAGMQTTFLAADYATRRLLDDTLFTKPTNGDAAIDAVLDKMSESKLRKRAPKKAESLASRIAADQGDTIVVDIDGLAQDVAAAGGDLNQVLQDIGIDPAAISEGESALGRVEVSAAKLLTSEGMQTHRDAVRPHIVFKGDAFGLTPREKEGVDQTMVKLAERSSEYLREEFGKAGDFAIQIDDLEQTIKARLEAANFGDTAEVNTVNARAGALIVAAMAKMRAEKTGEEMELGAFFEKFGPRIVGFGGAVSEGAAPKVQGEEMDPDVLGSSETIDPVTERFNGERIRFFDADPEIQARAKEKAERLAGGGMSAQDYLNEPGFWEALKLEILKEKMKANNEAYNKAETQEEKDALWNEFDVLKKELPAEEARQLAVIKQEQAERKARGNNPDQSGSADLLGQELSSAEMQTLDAETQEAITDPETDVLPLTDDMQVMQLDEFIAFHGTLAKFDKFENDKIGAGEGAQAFGPGHYFTQSRGIADWYRKRMKKLSPGIRMGKESFNKANPAHFALAKYWQYRDKVLHYDLFGGYKSLASNKSHSEALESAIFSLQYEIDQIEAPFLYPGGGPSGYAAADRPTIRDSRELAAFMKQGLAYLKTLDPDSSKGVPKPRKPALRGGGNIYTVAVKLPVEQTIQYDKPFGQQSPAVQKAFREAAEQGHLGEAGAALKKYGDKTRMGVLVAALKNMKSPAMDVMRANGIRGVRYLDGMSRGKKNKAGQSYNYVVFNDSDVKVLDREGKLFQMMEQERRGSFSPSTRMMTFTEARDASSFMHEMSHWFLGTLENLSETEAWAGEELAEIDRWYQSIRNGEQMKAIRARYSVVEEMGGFRVMYQGQPLELAGTPEEAEAKIEWRERHEAWAETFEQYLQTGKAPTPKLVSMFARFRDWLMQIYRSLLPGERANLTPEIRDYFDRIMMVDAEIDAAAAESFRDADDMAKKMLEDGIITERQYRMVGERLNKAKEEVKAEWIAEALKQEARTREEWWKTERARMRGDIARAFDRSKAGRMYNWLAYGQWKGDVPSSEALGDVSEVEFFQSAGGYETPGSPEYEAAKAKGLDMSQAGRMARAKEQGFDTDTVLYHGTKNDIEAFRRGAGGDLGPGIYFSTETGVPTLYAQGDGANILPVYARGRLANSQQFSDAVRAAEQGGARGHDAYIEAVAALERAGFDGIRDGGVVSIFDPSNIRSVNAAFDPDNSGSANLLGQSIRAATRMPMQEVGEWVLDNVTSNFQDYSNGDESAMMTWNLTDEPDSPQVLMSIRLSRKGRADVNLFLDNKMADALEDVKDINERRRLASDMFAQAVLVMRKYASETPELKAFNFIAAENKATAVKKKVTRSKAEESKSREELYRLLLSTLQMDGYTAYEVTGQMSVVYENAGEKSARPYFTPGSSFVLIKDGVDPNEFARSDILRGSTSRQDGGEVVTVLKAVQLTRPPRGGVDGRGREAGRPDTGGAVGDTLGQTMPEVDTTVAGGLTEKSFIRTRDLEGATIFPMFADLTDAGSTFAALDGLPIAPTPYLGGPNFPWLKSYRDAGIVWAFNAPNVITKVRNKVRALQEQARAEGRSDRVVITMLAMKDDAHTSNEMTITALLRTLDAVVEAGRFPQEQLAEAKRLIVSKADKKDEGYSELATFPGFGDAQALHDWSRGATFAGRKALAKEMRSAKFQQLPGMFPVERIVREAVDPDYRATQQGDALLAFEIDPDAEDLIIDFENKDQAGDVPRHPAYRYGMRGTLVGSFSTHIPMEVLYADLLPAVVGRSDPRADPMYLMKLLRTGDAQVITEDIVREAEVIEGLHDYRIAQAHTAGIAGQWRSSDAAANKGGVNPVEFERALLESEAAATLTPYTRTDVTKGKKDGSLRVFQLGGARVQDGGLNVWMAVKKGYDYRNEYPGEVTDALVEQGILTDNEVALVGVANNELGVNGMATFQVLKGIEEGVTVLDAFKVTSPSKPDGLLPTIYATLGFEEVGQIPFDPTKKDAQQLADLKAIWTRQGWNEADGYPAVAIMKWRGDDAVRPEATRRFILESQAGLGIGSGTDVAEFEAAQSRLPDSDVAGDQGDGLAGQGDGRADPRRFADRARGVSGTVRGYVENILAADARAVKALKLPQELIDRIRAEYGPVLEQRPDDTLGQSVAPTFYSALGRFVSRSGTARAPAAQWKGMIQNAPGIKAEEVEWTGVMEWLDLQEGSVTREALAAFVEANGVAVEEVTKGGVGVAAEAQQRMLPLIEERDRVQREFSDSDLGEDRSTFDAVARRLSELNDEIRNLQRTIDLVDDDAMNNTKWSSWTLPGGENYTELLLRLPVAEDRADLEARIDELGEQMDNFDFSQIRSSNNSTGLNDYQIMDIERKKLMSQRKVYRSSHWSEPNVLAHARFKERIGPNGERVLALEEIQSDWHQAGRERGYKDVVREPIPDDMLARYRDIQARFGIGGLDPAAGGITREEYGEYINRLAPLVEQGRHSEVPNAPFKNNAWTELVLKRMIRFAAENGFDAVAWIPGNIQNGKVVEDTGDNRGDFYDKIVPNAANKLGKKYGARVTQAPIDMPAQAKGTGWEDTGAPRQARDAGALQWWTLPITPELAAAAMTEGFPLFQPGDPKGWGETAPPPDMEPMRLDLRAVEEMYGKDVVGKLPAAVRKRSSVKGNLDDLTSIAEATRKTLKQKGPQSLVDFIRRRRMLQQDGSKRLRKWGIKGAADELKAMGMENLINEKSGMDIDYVREAAEEAGFIQAQGPDQPSTINDLLAALDREARGEKVYRADAIKETEEQKSAEMWAEWFRDRDINIFELEGKALRAALAKVAAEMDNTLVTPDQAAEKFGFEDGKALIEALISVGNRNKFLDQQADEAMVAEFGDMMKDGTLQREAEEAARLSIHGRQNELELEALARAVGVQAAGNYARGQARQIIAMRTVKEIAAYENDLRAERRFGKIALQAVQKGDMAGALRAKQKQLVAAALYTEGKKAHEKIEKTRQHLRTYETSETKRSRLAKAGHTYLEQMDDLLSRYRLRKEGPKAIRSMESLHAWATQELAKLDPLKHVQPFKEENQSDSEEAEADPLDRLAEITRDQQVAAEEDLAKSRTLERLAEESAGTSYQRLTFDEFMAVREQADMIYNLAKVKTNLMAQGDKRDFQKALGEIVDSILTNKEKDARQDPLETDLPAERTQRTFRDYMDAHRTLLSLFRQMDGGKDNGPLQMILGGRLSTAFGDRAALWREMEEGLAKLFEVYQGADRRGLFGTKVHVPEVGITMSKQGILAVALNMGTQKNRQRMMDSEGWSEADLYAIVDSLDQRDWQFVQDTWSFLDSWFPRANEVHTRVHGLPMDKAPAAEVVTKYGVLKGGYYPIVFDSVRSSKTAQRQLEKDAAAQAGRVGARSRAGFTKKRSEGKVAIPLRYSVLDVLVNHLSDVADSIALQEPLMDVGRIAVNPQFEAAVKQKYGGGVYRQILLALREAKQGQEVARNVIEKGLVHLRNGTTTVGLGWRFSTAALQIFGLSNSVVRVGGYWVAKGLARVGTSALSLQNAGGFATERSSMMANRVNSQQREIADLRNKFKGERVPGWVKESFFWMITTTQFYAVDLPTWLGQYEKSMANGATEAEAIIQADLAVQEAQGTGEIYGLAGIQRGSPLLKLFTNFLSYMVTTYNLAAQRTANTNFRNPAKAAAWATDMVLLLTFPVITKIMLDAALKGAGPDDDEDETWMGLYLKEQMAFLMSMNFFTSQVTGMVTGYSFDGPTGTAALKDIEKTGTELIQAANDEDQSVMDAYRPALRAAGAIFHVPTGQLDTSIMGLRGIMEGESDDYSDILFGPDQETREALSNQ